MVNITEVHVILNSYNPLMHQFAIEPLFKLLTGALNYILLFYICVVQCTLTLTCSVNIEVYYSACIESVCMDALN